MSMFFFFHSHNLLKNELGMTATFQAIPGMGHSGTSIYETNGPHLSFVLNPQGHKNIDLFRAKN